MSTEQGATPDIPAGHTTTSDVADPVTVLPGSNPAGWYPFGAAARRAFWDAEAWTGEAKDDSSVSAPVKWHHRVFAFLGHAWFWVVVAGCAITAALGWGKTQSASGLFAWLTILGLAVMMLGAVMLVDRHLHFRQVNGLWVIVACGVVAGAVAVAIASWLEGSVEPKVFRYMLELLALAGPVEETSKLLVPVLLLAFGGARFRDPRAGLLLVLVAGAVFGIAEGRGYIAKVDGNMALVQAIGRPLGELLHVYLTGFAAAVIWLAARRAGHVFTRAGIVAWVVVMAIHSLHDVLPGLFKPGQTPDEYLASRPLSTIEALQLGVPTLILNLTVAVLLFLLQRHSARELTPPNAISSNAPHWRPQLKQWGRRVRSSKGEGPQQAIGGAS